jgi:arylsulfatase
MSDRNHQNRQAGRTLNRRSVLLGSTTLAAASALGSGAPIVVAQAQQRPAPATAPPSGKKPNILVIFGDDIGQTNVSAYSFGLMGYKTPNIDRIAREGMMFTDYYAEQSCTAGRSSFITGQCTLRTGLSKVGLPGATVGLQARDATTAELLKPLGYATGQFGKNHLGDRNEYLPTVHGSTSSSATSTTSTRRRIRRTAFIRATPLSAKLSARAVCCAARHRIVMIRPNSRAGAESASKRSKTPAR